jgi:hypothetical protein
MMDRISFTGLRVRLLFLVLCATLASFGIIIYTSGSKIGKLTSTARRARAPGSSESPLVGTVQGSFP